jgi:hypothetical protein
MGMNFPKLELFVCAMCMGSRFTEMVDGSCGGDRQIVNNESWLILKIGVVFGKAPPRTLGRFKL